MDDLFRDLATYDCHDTLFRNFVSLRESQDLFDDLSNDHAEQQIAIQHEMAIKATLYNSSRPIIDRPFEEAEWLNVIGYPFQNLIQSRFSNGTYGVWYGGDTLETSIYETAYHWRHKFLADMGMENREGMQSERKVCTVQCDALLLDFRTKVTSHPALVDPNNYTFTQQVGLRIQSEGHPGLISKSARCAGDLYAILTPTVLSSPAAHCSLTYRIENGYTIVERQLGMPLLTIA